MSITGSKATVIIIGGTSGVGLGLALKHLQLGWQVIVVGRQANKITTLNQHHPDMVTFQCDITDKSQQQELFKQLQQYYFTRLIYCAGWYVNERTQHLNQSDSSRMLAVNLQAFQRCFDWASEYLTKIQLQAETHSKIKAESRRQIITEINTHPPLSLICIASAAGLVNYPYASLYAKSKRAMIATASAYRLALAPYAIQVNCIAMGYVNTQTLRKLNQGDASHKPFIRDQQYAVQKIMQAIEANIELAVFPKRMDYLIRGLNKLPKPLLHWLMQRKLDKKT